MREIIYPPTVDYYYMHQRPQQMMKVFARAGWKAHFMNHDHYVAQPTGIQEIEPNLFLYNRAGPVANKPIFYYSYPEHVSCLGRFDEQLVVFDSIDEPTEEFAHWAPRYEEAVRRADVVLASSQKLYDMAKRLNNNVHLVPNGVDFDHFHRTEQLPRPADLPPGPIVGFYGALATWVDWEMVERLTRLAERVGWSVVMIGCLYGIGKEQIPSGVHYLGYKDYEELPRYLQHFDVAIIPFKVTSMIESCNPIKMWEYLAAGKPVVTTALPEAQQLKEVYVSRHYDEFLANVAVQIQPWNNSAEVVARRIELARQNSWDARAKVAMAAIEEALERKGL